MSSEDTCVSLVPIFQGLSHEEQLQVARVARPIRRARGEVIHRPSDHLSQLLVVHRGQIRVTHLEPDGQERLLRILGPGDFMGEAAFLTGDEPDSWATALTEVELCSFRHADLHTLVEQYPTVTVRMLKTLTERLILAERRLSDLTLAPVSTRLARYLLEVSAGGSQAQFRLPLAKKDVASLLGMSPATLSRQLRMLEEQGLIEVSGRAVTLLNPDGLVRLGE